MLRTTEAFILSLAVVAMMSLVEIYPGRGTTYQSHFDIDINGNSGFTSANGVTSGAGTASSPYVIQGWIIRSVSVAIYIHNTNVYFIIENVDVCVQGTLGPAIALENVTHGLLQHSQLPSCTTDSANSISIDGSKDITISDNNIEDHQAINTYHSSNLTISGNYVNNGIPSPSSGYGIAGPARIYVDHSNNSVFAGNNMFGVVLQMTGSEGNLVYHNNFLERCAYYCPVIGGASDDQPGLNSWDDGYPSGGNYWINYTAADRCSGSNQDVCPGSDGIADRPYHFQNATDKYPLMRAYGDQAPPNWNSSKTLTAQRIGQTSLTLQWSGASDDLDVAGYRIYGNGMFLTSVGRDNSSILTPVGRVNSTISITGLSPGTTYTFYIVAVDVANTTSVDGPSLNVNTLPLWWQVTSLVWWQLNWVWGMVVITAVAATSLRTAFYWRRSKRQKKLTEFA